MNEWISNIFERLLTLMHVIVILGLVIYLFTSLNNSRDITTPVLITLMIFLIYVIIIGTLTTFISINKTLQRVESELKKQTIHLHSSSSGMAKTARKHKVQLMLSIVVKFRPKDLVNITCLLEEIGFEECERFFSHSNLHYPVYVCDCTSALNGISLQFSWFGL